MLKKIEKSIFLTKPIIGIVGRGVDNYHKVNDNVFKKVIKCGGVPILILPTSNEDLNIILKICDGIIMPGGTDIYDYDKYICKYCINNDIPILGICLGMQIMANLNEDNLKKVSNHQGVSHKITTIKDSILDKLLNNKIVNSRHNECIINSKEYKVSALSEDKIIEGIEHPKNRFNVGVQWHPEDLSDDSLFLELIKQSQKK